MTRKVNAKSICWALDPLEGDIDYHTHALDVLMPFALGLKVKVTPLSCLPFARRSKSQKTLFERLSLNTEYMLGGLRTGSFKNILTDGATIAPKKHSLSALRDKVATINRESKRRHALFIALHSHSRKGAKRFFLGSFAETSMLLNEVPTLIINPKCKPAPHVRHILFATDFSHRSLHAFDTVLEFAAKLGAAVTVVHYVQVSELAVYLRKTSRLQFEKDLERIQTRLEKKGAKLTEKGLKHKVRVKFHLLTNFGVFDPADMILKFAKASKPHLLALAAQSGPWSSVLIGALSRQIVRGAECPVLILRSRT